MHKISRSDAKRKGLKFYFTGKECVNGHVVKRQVSNGCCYECALVRSREHSRNNKDKRREYRLKNADKIKKSNKEYSIKNADKIKKYKIENAERIKKSVKEYYEKNLTTISDYKKQWYQDNKQKHLTYSRNRYDRVKNNPSFKMSKTMRQMLRRLLLLTGEQKVTSTENILGYTKNELMVHLESLFTDGMSWDNYGDWHIDHIIPISKFLEMNVKEPKVVNALSNLQPLWAKDNLSKGSKC